ncbi:MAG: hypothetical protein CM15mP103_09720 [Gammaproteobacteria bacterium]|nr:MAG: hypothetical protein CM15mP103_09720 [Gammaproteobacteria bacterium]
MSPGEVLAKLGTDRRGASRWRRGPLTIAFKQSEHELRRARSGYHGARRLGIPAGVTATPLRRSGARRRENTPAAQRQSAQLELDEHGHPLPR